MCPKSQDEICRQQYVSSLWGLLHVGNDSKAMFFLKSYIDDSGSDDDSPLACAGGPIMTQDRHALFERDWYRLLDHNRIASPLKMSDFVKPYGKYLEWSPFLSLNWLSQKWGPLHWNANRRI